MTPDDPWEAALLTAIQSHSSSTRVSSAGREGRPDLTIAVEPLLHIECTKLTKGDASSPDSVVDQGADGKAYFYDGRATRLRLTHSLKNKEEQTERWLKAGRLSEDDRLILALDTTELGKQYQTEDSLWVLYGRGQYFVTINRQSGRVVEEGISYEPRVEKPSKEIRFEAKFFANRKYPFCAVIVGDRLSRSGGLRVLNCFVAPEHGKALADEIAEYVPLYRAFCVEGDEERFRIIEFDYGNINR